MSDEETIISMLKRSGVTHEKYRGKIFIGKVAILFRPDGSLQSVERIRSDDK